MDIVVSRVQSVGFLPADTANSITARVQGSQVNEILFEREMNTLRTGTYARLTIPSRVSRYPSIPGEAAVDCCAIENTRPSAADSFRLE